MHDKSGIEKCYCIVTRLSFLPNRVATRRVGNIMKISGKNADAAAAIVAISRLSK